MFTSAPTGLAVAIAFIRGLTDRPLGNFYIDAISDFKCEHGSEVREFHLRLQPLNASDDCALELGSWDYKKLSFEDEYNLKLVATLEPTLVAV
jgi:hypothetical protein